MTTQAGWGRTVIGACQAVDRETFCGLSVDVSSGNTKRCHSYNSSPRRVVRSFMSSKDGSSMKMSLTIAQAGASSEKRVEKKKRSCEAARAALH